MDHPTLYFLAGLGFDYRIFDNLTMKREQFNRLNWLEPETNESLDKYVKRMADQIVKDSNPIILIGHSFGGIIVQEISRLINVEKVIIISSIKSKDEIPTHLKFLKLFPIYKILNQKLILSTFPIWARTFGYKSEKGRVLFIQMINNCTDNYFRWSMDKIVNWNGNDNSNNVIHIHGTRDKTFPINLIKNPILIPDGSHFMVFSKAEEVSEALIKVIG
jgi:pimeloyl-ACP methyl ester carboxylesterase